MKKILALLFGVFIVSCAALSIYFVIVLISSTDTVTEQYESMVKPEPEGHGSLKYNIISTYYAKTGDDSIFVRLNVSNAMRDSIVSRYNENEDELPDEGLITNIPECTCTGTTPCTEGNCQDCEACKENVNYCKLRHNGYADGKSDEAWEILRNISLSKSFNGFRTWAQGSPPIYSQSGSTGCCFYVAMLGLCNANGAGANVADVFAAAGAGEHGGLKLQNNGNVKLDITVSGSKSKAQEIADNLGVGITFSDATKSDISNGGTYLIHVSSDTNGVYASRSAQQHWFVVSNNTVVTPAQGMYGQQFDPNVACVFDHVYRVD